MTLDVVFAGSGAGLAGASGRAVIVVDVLRATTTIAAALAAGARRIVPVPNPATAVRAARALGQDTLLAGERACAPIAGFHLGNSPREMTAEAVGGRSVVLCTTNGTPALLGAGHAATVTTGALVNLGAAVGHAAEQRREGRPVTIVCAGRAGAFGLDDAWVAGRILQALGPGDSTSDGARAALALAEHFGDDALAVFRASAAGRALLALGYDADLGAAAAVDAHPVLPIFQDGVLTAHAVAAA